MAPDFHRVVPPGAGPAGCDRRTWELRLTAMLPRGNRRRQPGGDVTPRRYSRSAMAKKNVPFKMVSDFDPAGDQPKAIAALAEGIASGERFQTLLGITGSGKSATIAWTIEQVQRPTLVHRAQQVAGRPAGQRVPGVLPGQPGRVLRLATTTTTSPRPTSPRRDTYIEKDSSVNDEIDRLRHSATSALLTRRDVDRGRLGVVHLRPRLARGVPRQPARPAGGRGASTSAPSCASSSTCSTSATT